MYMLRKKSGKIIPFTIASKKKKNQYLEISLTDKVKDLYNENNKMLNKLKI
jgi:hypothetical protein